MSVTDNPRVLTVVLNYRHLDDTVRCVRSLRAGDYRNQRLLVVDNTEDPAASGALGDMLGPEVEVLAAGRNLGYAGGNNLGIRRALDERADLVWLVNPDAVVERTTLRQLVSAMNEHVDAAAAGPRIVLGDSDPARIWFDGGLIDWTPTPRPRHRHSGQIASKAPITGVVDVDYVTGAALLLRCRALKHVGLLPEEYFLYFEETDLCQRLLGAGWRVIVDERAWMAHFQRSDGPARTPYYIYYMTRNWLHFARRWSGVGVDEALPSVRAWLSRLRDQAAKSVPAWVPVFDDLVERAIADARADMWGPRPDIAAVPTAEDILAMPTPGR